jgi:alpha-glucosidase
MKTIHKLILAGIVTANLLFVSCAEPSEVKVTSPNGTYTFTCYLNEEGEGIFYSLEFLGREIIAASRLGFVFSDKVIREGNIMIKEVIRERVESSWRPVYGEKNQYPDVYNQAILQVGDGGLEYRLVLRAYDEGVAFRFGFPEGELKILEEKTEFALPGGTLLWASERAQSEIFSTPAEELDNLIDRPVLAQLPDSLFVAIGEAGLVDFARMRFTASDRVPGALKAKLDGEVQTNGAFTTPWRFIMAAEKPGKILENNYLLLNLNEPNRIEDASWIKPGKVIREVTLTTRGGMACVDFAAEHNLSFVEFDAGWYGHEYEEHSDATTVTVDPKRSKGPLDLAEVIRYADSKGIGVLLYVNRRALEKQLDEILPLFRSWGIRGVKYGFVNVGSQKWTSWLHEAVRKAADHQLMVDIHDEYRPTGYSRTYPNLMTQEGIRGDEESPDNAMVLKTLFTRMIAGAGDHTNCYFAPRVDEKMGSHASQLAKLVCIYSPWQFVYWYDRPARSDPDEAGAGGSRNRIREVPELEFIDAVPTVWDDTRVLNGYPGEFAVVARRSGDRWFVGVLNGTRVREFEIPLDFLDPGQSYEASLYFDDPGAGTITRVGIEKQKVTSRNRIDRLVKAGNGLAIIFEQINNP